MDPYDPYASTPVRYPSTSHYVSATPVAQGPIANARANGSSVSSATPPRPNAGGAPAKELPGAPTGNARYACMMLPTKEADEIEDVVAQVGLDGVKVFSRRDETKATKAFALPRIAKWALSDGTMLRIDVKSEDGDESLVFSADKGTIAALMDVLTTSAFQWCELNGHDALDTVTSTTNGRGVEWINLKASTTRDTRDVGTSGRIALASGVRFWENPEHGGWLAKQGEHFRTWRRRWFVLKDGHLAWFKSNAVNAKTLPRGVIPLSTVESVSIPADSTVGKPFGIHIAGAHAMKVGAQFLVADSEQERKFWIDALRRATQTSGEQLAAGFAQAATPTSPSPASFTPQTAPTSAPRFDASNIQVEVPSYTASYRMPEPQAPRRATPNAQSYVTLPPLPFAHPSSVAGAAAFDAPAAAPGSEYYSSAYSARAPPSDWATYHTPEGKPYYYNAMTGVTSWDPPR